MRTQRERGGWCIAYVRARRRSSGNARSLRERGADGPLGGEGADRLPCVAVAAPQMDPKFLRNLRFAKKWNGKGRGAEDEE